MVFYSFDSKLGEAWLGTGVSNAQRAREQQCPELKPAGNAPVLHRSWQGRGRRRPCHV